MKIGNRTLSNIQNKSCKLWLLLLLNLCMPSVRAGMFRADHREHVNWSSAPYNKIVMLLNKDYYGTAEYVAPDIILTARHCVTAPTSLCVKGDVFQILLPSNERAFVVLEKFGKNNRNDDWALLRVIDSAYFSDDYFNVTTETPDSTVDRAGFGYLRKLSVAEIDKIREIWMNSKWPKKRTATFAQFWQQHPKQMKEAGISNLYDIDSTTNETRLKVHKNCTLKKSDAFGGDSGGPMYSGDKLYGIATRASSYIGAPVGMSVTVIPSEKYIDALNEMKQHQR